MAWRNDPIPKNVLKEYWKGKFEDMVDNSHLPWRYSPPFHFWVLYWMQTEQKQGRPGNESTMMYLWSVRADTDNKKTLTLLELRLHNIRWWLKPQKSKNLVFHSSRQVPTNQPGGSSHVYPWYDTHNKVYTVLFLSINGPWNQMGLKVSVCEVSWTYWGGFFIVVPVPLATIHLGTEMQRREDHW